MEMLRYGNVALDVDRGSLRDANGAEVALRPKSLGLLLTLARNRGQVLRVREIRRAIGDPEGQILRTIIKRGCLDVEVRTASKRLDERRFGNGGGAKRSGPPGGALIVEALEGEVCDVLGRERYERGEGEKAGDRNGYRAGKVKTAEGAVEYSAPQVRDTPEPFVSSVAGGAFGAQART